MRLWITTALMTAIFVGLAAVGAIAMPWMAFGDDEATNAIEGKDYNAFMEVADKKYQEWKDGFTEEDFLEMAERPIRNNKMHFNESRRTNLKELEEAMEALDYDAWAKAVGDDRMTVLITKENFSDFVEMHEAMKSGEVDTAKALAEALGLEEMPSKHKQHR